MIQIDIISVGVYLERLNTTLKTEKAKIVGEVSEVKIGPTGHVYFSMKDEKNGSTISCIIWSFKYKMYGVELKNGLKIYATGAPNIYPQSGRLSFIADVIEVAGEGALQVAYEKLRKKLESEGFFAESRKKSIPKYSHRIGLITSKNGAVINDFLTNIGKFGYEILFVDSRVEGQDAVEDLMNAINTLKSKEIDVLVIMRGGGSLESFLAFNNETLVRAIADFPVPVLTGIGHEKDISLVSLASDKNVSTPTAVASLLNSSWLEALSQIRLSEEKIFSRFLSILEIFKNAEKTLFSAIILIDSQIQRVFENISTQAKELVRSLENMNDQTRDLLSQSAKSIEVYNPQNQLARGYSIVRHNGKVLRSVKNAKKNEKLDISLSDGIIKSQVI